MKSLLLDMLWAALAVLLGSIVFWAAMYSDAKDRNVKLCAESLVTVNIGAECASTTGCMFTMTDLERLRNAQANRQAYCPANDNPAANN